MPTIASPSGPSTSRLISGQWSMAVGAGQVGTSIWRSSSLTAAQTLARARRSVQPRHLDGHPAASGLRARQCPGAGSRWPSPRCHHRSRQPALAVSRWWVCGSDQEPAATRRLYLAWKRLKAPPSASPKTNNSRHWSTACGSPAWMRRITSRMCAGRHTPRRRHPHSATSHALDWQPSPAPDPSAGCQRSGCAVRPERMRRIPDHIGCRRQRHHRALTVCRRILLLLFASSSPLLAGICYHGRHRSLEGAMLAVKRLAVAETLVWAFCYYSFPALCSRIGRPILAGAAPR